MYAGIWEIDLHGKNEYQARVTLDAALRPSPDYDVSRWLYVPNTYSEYRYILGTRGQKSLICVGINPSTAAPDGCATALSTRKTEKPSAICSPFRSPLLSGPPGGTSSKSGITSWTVCGISPLTVRPQTLNGSPPGRF